jgi:glycosyltransferase involved in cell wall biosynthesis
MEKISIIIPSYNRLDELEELFPTLEKQTLDRKKFEIIIVDDGSTDGTENFVKNYKSSNLEIHFFKQKNQGPGAARNLGLKKATGDFFVFIDSDVILPNEFVEEIYKKVNAENLDGFGGPDRAHESFSPLLKAIDYAMTSFITTGGLRGKKGKKLAKFYPRSFNMGLSRSLYEKIGGFGSLRHGQDIEFSNRMIKSGAKIGFVETAYVFHKRRTSLKKFFKQVFNWGVARINLYKLDSAMLEPLHALPAIATALFILILATSSLSFFNKYLTILMLSVMFVVFFLSMIHAWFKYKTFKTLFYVPFTMFFQIFGYGLGFITAFFRRVVFGGREFKGFSKKYYK